MTVSIRNLTKRYGATLALDSVDLQMRSGEVHALLGHNGAGKSTVIGCLGGRTAPTQGTIDIDGTEYASLDPRTAIASGIAVIYQHLSLVDSLTVTENLFLGQELTRGGVIRRGEQRRIASTALDRVGLAVPLDAIVGELSMGQRQMIEIAKALQREAKLLILDEPSAALSPVESRRLAALVLSLKEQGIAILYVTHLLEEVMRVADTATVLSGGQVVWESNDFTKQDLVTAISGTAHESPAPVQSDPEAAALLTLKNFSVGSSPSVDVSVRPGEIVALYGLIGSGRTRLLEGLFGRRKSDGTVVVDGAPIDNSSPDRALAAGVALVPSDRIRQGLFGSLGAGENVLTRTMRVVGAPWLRNLKAEKSLVRRTFDVMSVRPNSPDLPVGSFSGGNQQKVLIGRWVNDASSTRVLLLDDPTQGVDVGARAEIYAVIRSLARERGVAVLFATNEPEEVLALAHRCLIVQNGSITEDLAVGAVDEESLLDRIHSPVA